MNPASLTGSDWVDPNDPTVIAEAQLLRAANSIEAAARKLAELQPRSLPKVRSLACSLAARRTARTQSSASVAFVLMARKARVSSAYVQRTNRVPLRLEFSLLSLPRIKVDL